MLSLFLEVVQTVESNAMLVGWTPLEIRRVLIMFTYACAHFNHHKAFCAHLHTTLSLVVFSPCKDYLNQLPHTCMLEMQSQCFGKELKHTDAFYQKTIRGQFDYDAFLNTYSEFWPSDCQLNVSLILNHLPSPAQSFKNTCV